MLRVYHTDINKWENKRMCDCLRHLYFLVDVFCFRVDHFRNFLFLQDKPFAFVWSFHADTKRDALTLRTIFKVLACVLRNLVLLILRFGPVLISAHNIFFRYLYN